MTNLSEINILIIEDDMDVIHAIKQALLEMSNSIGSKFNDSNIHFVHIEKKKDASYHEANSILAQVLETIRTKSIDTLFIDLNYGGDTSQGLNLIRLLVNDNLYAMIPKYIITQERNFLTLEKDGVFYNADIEHYCTVFKKPDNQHKYKGYIKIFEKKALVETLPILVDLYRKDLNSLGSKEFVEKVMHSIDESQLNEEKIIHILSAQSKILGEINFSIKNIDERTKLIEIITKVTVAALPKITDKAKAKKLVEEWQGDGKLLKVMGDDFPELPKGLYQKLKGVAEGFADSSTEDIGKFLYEAGKEYINNEAGIEEGDAKLDMLMKYTAYFTEKTYSIVGKEA